MVFETQCILCSGHTNQSVNQRHSTQVSVEGKQKGNETGFMDTTNLTRGRFTDTYDKWGPWFSQVVTALRAFAGQLTAKTSAIVNSLTVDEILNATGTPPGDATDRAKLAYSIRSILLDFFFDHQRLGQELGPNPPRILRDDVTAFKALYPGWMKVITKAITENLILKKLSPDQIRTAVYSPEWDNLLNVEMTENSIYSFIVSHTPDRSNLTKGHSVFVNNMVWAHLRNTLPGDEVFNANDTLRNDPVFGHLEVGDGINPVTVVGLTGPNTILNSSESTS